MAAGTTAATRPQRMSLASLTSGQTLEVQYNPTELETSIGVVYGKLLIPGMSHQEHQYSHTENLKIPLNLEFDALARLSERYDALTARRVLESFCYAPRGASTVRAGAPTRVLFVWPTLVTIQARIMSLKVKFTRFAASGFPTAFSASMDLEEVRDVRLCAEDVLATGTIRSGLKVSEEF